MKWYWTWSGRCFGYRNGDNLFTADGEHVGYFVDESIYACGDGRYLGELKNGRLITNKSRKSHKKYPKAKMVGGSYASYANYVGFVMYAGYEDFMEDSK